jgi:hypothetical protein
MAYTKKFSARQLKLLDEARRIIADAKNNVSVQPRFQTDADTGVFSGRLNWPKGIFETVPPYKPDSQARTKWLQSFWPQEPMLAGLINSGSRARLDGATPRVVRSAPSGRWHGSALASRGLHLLRERLPGGRREHQRAVLPDALPSLHRGRGGLTYAIV